MKKFAWREKKGKQKALYLRAFLFLIVDFRFEEGQKSYNHLPYTKSAKQKLNILLLFFFRREQKSPNSNNYTHQSGDYPNSCTHRFASNCFVSITQPAKKSAAINNPKMRAWNIPTAKAATLTFSIQSASLFFIPFSFLSIHAMFVNRCVAHKRAQAFHTGQHFLYHCRHKGRIVIRKTVCSGMIRVNKSQF